MPGPDRALGRRPRRAPSRTADIAEAVVDRKVLPDPAARRAGRRAGRPRAVAPTPAAVEDGVAFVRRPPPRAPCCLPNDGVLPWLRVRTAASRGNRTQRAPAPAPRAADQRHGDPGADGQPARRLADRAAGHRRVVLAGRRRAAGHRRTAAATDHQPGDRAARGVGSGSSMPTAPRSSARTAAPPPWSASAATPRSPRPAHVRTLTASSPPTARAPSRSASPPSGHGRVFVDGTSCSEAHRRSHRHRPRARSWLARQPSHPVQATAGARSPCASEFELDTRRPRSVPCPTPLAITIGVEPDDSDPDP